MFLIKINLLTSQFTTSLILNAIKFKKFKRLNQLNFQEEINQKCTQMTIQKIQDDIV